MKWTFGRIERWREIEKGHRKKLDERDCLDRGMAAITYYYYYYSVR